MHIFLDDHVLIVKSDPNFWAKLRFGRNWIRSVTCSIYETKDISLKSHSGILTLYITTETARYRVFISAKNKKRALKLIYDFKIIKKNALTVTFSSEKPASINGNDFKEELAVVNEIAVEDKADSATEFLESYKDLDKNSTETKNDFFQDSREDGEEEEILLIEFEPVSSSEAEITLETVVFEETASNPETGVSEMEESTEENESQNLFSLDELEIKEVPEENSTPNANLDLNLAQVENPPAKKSFSDWLDSRKNLDMNS